MNEDVMTDPFYDEDIDVDEEKYAQRIEINIADMSAMLTILMKNGYDCLVWQDGESMDWVTIEYISREYTGHRFEEVAL